MRDTLTAYYFVVAICVVAVAAFRDSPLIKKKRDMYVSVLLYPPLVLVFGRSLAGWEFFLLFLMATALIRGMLRAVREDAGARVTEALWFRFLLIEILLPLPALVAGDLFRRAGVDPLPVLATLFYASALYVFFVRAPNPNRIG